MKQLEVGTMEIDMIAGEPMVCEQHPWLLWPSRDPDCGGPGMPLSAARTLIEANQKTIE